MKLFWALFLVLPKEKKKPKGEGKKALLTYLLGSAMSACSWRTRRSLPLAQWHSTSQGIILLRSLSNVHAATSNAKRGNVRSTCLTVLSMVVTCHVTHRAIPLWPYSHWKIFFFSGDVDSAVSRGNWVCWRVPEVSGHHVGRKHHPTHAFRAHNSRARWVFSINNLFCGFGGRLSVTGV